METAAGIIGDVKDISNSPAYTFLTKLAEDGIISDVTYILIF